MNGSAPNGKSINWRALLFGPLWLAYRKTYLNAGINLIVIAIVSVASYVAERQLGTLPTAAERAVYIGLTSAFGFLANWLYLQHATIAVNDILMTSALTHIEHRLAGAGSVSAAAAIAMLTAPLPLASCCPNFAIGGVARQTGK
jgi:hypothetical protein